MSTKTISLRMEAYEKLRRAKRNGESFSDVVMRARWDDVPVTGQELLSLVRERGPTYSDEELAAVEAVKTESPEGRDKWPTTSGSPPRRWPSRCRSSPGTWTNTAGCRALA